METSAAALQGPCGDAVEVIKRWIQLKALHSATVQAKLAPPDAPRRSLHHPRKKVAAEMRRLLVRLFTLHLYVPGL
jgi:hypothetical protein